MKRVCLVWLLILFGLGFIVPLMLMSFYRAANLRAKEQLLGEIRNRYPQAQVTGGISFERRRVDIHVWNMNSADQQGEFVKYLTQLKAAHEMKAEIWLWFKNQKQFSDTLYRI
jgi:hypothetical protein